MRTKLLIIAAAALILVSAGANPVNAQAQAGRTGDAEAMANTQAGPGEWIRVGVDENNDGRIDRFEYLYRPDLERALRRSMQRQGEAGAGGSAGYYPEQRGMREEQPEWSSVTGRVEDLKRFGLAEMEDEHLFAKIRTADGRVARVDLGPAVNLRDLDLKRGDTITVHGRRGTVNDKAMLMANRVEAGGRAISVGWPNDLNLSRYSGEVLGARVARFRNARFPDQVFARVLLDQGGVTTVNLGPADMPAGMTPEELRGKRIDFLAHPARIGDRVALVAEELRVDGRTVQVDWALAEAPRAGSRDSVRRVR